MGFPAAPGALTRTSYGMQLPARFQQPANLTLRKPCPTFDSEQGEPEGPLSAAVGVKKPLHTDPC